MIFAALVLAPGATEAATLKVHAVGDDGRQTIQEAINAADEGDTVLVGPGTYVGPGNRDIEVHGKSIVLLGSDGPAMTILDCQGRPGDPHRGLFIHEGEGRGTRIQGFTITGGYVEGRLPANYGGGILCLGTSPTIEDCWLVNNRSDHFGGGMVCYLRSSPKLTNMRFIDNAAVNNGGGLGVKSFCSAEVSNALFVRNTAKRGGGLWCLNSSLTLDQATFFENAGLESSGGIWSSQGEMTIRNTIIASSRSGEALSCSSPPQVFMHCCDIFGNVGGDDLVGCLTAGSGNFNVDPQFTDPAAGDFAPSASSPCRRGRHPFGLDCPEIGYRSAQE
jgi:hypothetical protein